MLLVIAGPGPPAALHQDSVIPAVLLPTKPDGGPWIVENADRCGRSEFTLKPILPVSSSLATRDAVLEGAGAVLLPRFVVEEDFSQGRLACWGRSPDRPVELGILYRSRRLRSPKFTAFADFLSAKFKEPRSVI